jgi:hypothetical protein
MAHRRPADRPGALAPDRVQEGLLEVMAYLAAAASLNLDESPGYGHLRLLEGLQRSFRLLVDLGLADEELGAAAADLDARVNRFKNDRAGARETADRLAALFVARIAPRADPP